MGMMTDDLCLKVEHPSTSLLRSRSISPQPRHSDSSDNASTPSYPMQPLSTTNGVNNDKFHIPRYNFPSNLVSTPRRKTSKSMSPAPRNSRDCSSVGTTELSTNGHHVTETHHITKDYDERTGAKTINRYQLLDTIGRGVHGK